MWTYFARPWGQLYDFNRYRKITKFRCKTFTFEYKIFDLLHLSVAGDLRKKHTLYSLVPFDRLFVICISRLVAGRVEETVFEVQVDYEHICIITQQMTDRFKILFAQFKRLSITTRTLLSKPHRQLPFWTLLCSHSVTCTTIHYTCRICWVFRK